MKFNEYEKMECSLSRLEVNKQMEKATWVVTEKVHGANFSFHVDEDTVKVARRRAFLHENENFFCYRDSEFMKTYPDKMKDVYKSVVEKFPEKNIKQVSIWGELFGGKRLTFLRFFTKFSMIKEMEMLRSKGKNKFQRIQKN